MATGARPKWTVLEFILGPKEIGAPVMPIALRKVKRKYQVIFVNSFHSNYVICRCCVTYFHILEMPKCSGVPSTDWNCCSTSSPCNIGEGDCDRDSHCSGSLICGSNNCQKDFSSSGSNWQSSADCCEGKNFTNFRGQFSINING